MNMEMLTSMVGNIVKIDRGGPESKTGQMLEVSSDFFTLLTEDDGVVFYNMQHIKSITQSTKNSMELDLLIPENFTYKRGENFTGLLNNMKYHWVKINRGGPEKLEGVLEDINKDFVTVISNEEIIRMSIYHLKSISYGLKVEKPKEQSEEKAEKKTEENKDNKDNKEKKD